MGTLDGRVALITGGGKGIGKGIALKFAQEGAKVVIGCNSNAGMAAETLEMLKAYTDAIAVQADVGTPEGCRKLVDETVATFGGLDIFVNNAAMQTQYSLLEQRDMSNFDLELRVNTRAAMLIMQYALPYLKASGHGRVIVITSIHGKRPFVGDACYSVSKAALKMLYREAAVEFAKYGITVNAIAPGGVKVEFKTGHPRRAPRLDIQRDVDYSQLTVRGMPSDIADMAAYIASNESRYLNGATIRIDGGNCLVR